MTDVLGALSFCLGGLSFILNTVPAAAKFADEYRERKQQIEGVEKRLALCQSKYNTWEKHWHSSKLTEHGAHLQSSIVDIRSLRTEIDNAIKANATTATETRAWQRMKARLNRGIFRKPRIETPDFCNAIRYALWQRQRLEGWTVRLETAIDVIDKLFERDFNLRTADHFSGTPSLKQVEEVACLESFAGTLMSLATDMYTECMGIQPSTYAWALGLQPPTTRHTILD